MRLFSKLFRLGSLYISQKMVVAAIHYTVMNIDEQQEQREKAEKYDRMQAQLRLMCELTEGRRSGEEEGWISSEDVRNHFRARANAK